MHGILSQEGAGEGRGLCGAIDAGKVAAVRNLLEADVDPNAPEVLETETSHASISPIAYAVERDRYDIAKLLLDFGADPDAQLLTSDTEGSQKHTPLTLAIENASEEMLDLLLTYGADPEISAERRTMIGDVHIVPPLCLALEMGHISAARLLIEHQADPNCRAYHDDPDGGETWTPLGLAVAQGMSDIALMLLLAGADPGVGYEAGGPTGIFEYSALAIAARQDDIEATRTLLRFGTSPDDGILCISEPELFSEKTALRIALESGAHEVVRVLAGFGPTIEPRDLLLAFDTPAEELFSTLRDRAPETAVQGFRRGLLLRALAADDVDGARGVLEMDNGVVLGGDSPVLLRYAYGSEGVRAFIRDHGEPAIGSGELSLLHRLLDTWPEPGGSFPVDLLYHDPPLRFPMATSVLHDEGVDFRYAPEKAFDGDPATCWVEGDGGDGIGHKIAFVIDPWTAAIGVLPGFGTQQWHRANNRVRRAVFTVYLWTRRYSDFWGKETHLLEEVSYRELAFEDALEVQRREVELGDPAYRHGRVQQGLIGVLEILEVYPGDRWRDTCIAEIHLYDGEGNER